MEQEDTMQKLKRSECAVLTLVLKRKWYDMIASCEKREEYRDYTLYWRKRIGKWENTNSCKHPKFYQMRAGVPNPFRVGVKASRS